MQDSKILYLIKDLEKIILDIIRDDISKEKINIPTPTQLGIIKFILDSKNEPVYQKDLEKNLHLRRATISGVLKTMEKNGLIQRKTSDVDARVKEITLNPKTLNIYEEKKVIIKRIDEILSKNVDSTDLQKFISIMKQIIENLENNLSYIKGEKNKNV